MDKGEIIKLAVEFTEHSPLNRISQEEALNPEFVGIRFFETPIFAFGDAEDNIFKQFKAASVIGQHYKTPSEWLEGAKTVISFFLPFSAEIRAGNAHNMAWPSGEWLHGRIEGQNFISALSALLELALTQAGYLSVSPLLDDRFYSVNYEEGLTSFTSNWSERHAAYACGLGTFSLSKGLITEKGMAGRFGSVITTLPVETDSRPYKGFEDYCTKCGQCAQNCPVNAITLEKGKEHKPCYDFQAEVLQKEKPYFGCGKCQVSVPCETGIHRHR